MTIESREQDPGSARASRKSRGSPAIIEAGGSGADAPRDLSGGGSGLDLDALEKVALAALADKPHAQSWERRGGRPVKHANPWNAPVASANSETFAEHIATFDPPTSLRLIEEIRDADAALVIAHSLQGFATGHGDTLTDLVMSLSLQSRDRAERAEAEAQRLIQTQRELVAALKHEVANCPLCKGEGRAVDIMELIRALPLSGEEITGEKVECPRCKDHRALIARIAKAEGRS